MSLAIHWSRFSYTIDPTAEIRHFIIVYNQGKPSIVGHYWCEFIAMLSNHPREVSAKDVREAMHNCSQFSFPRDKTICVECWKHYVGFFSIIDTSQKIVMVD